LYKRSIYASIKLAITKTGINQSVSITNVGIATLLKDLVHYNNVNLNMNSHGLVFGMNAQTYRSLFHRACSSLGFESIGYTPHSLRHGGATYLHMNGMDVKNLMLIGRWRSESSLTIYVQVGAVLLLGAKISVQMFNIAKLLIQHIVQTIRMIKNSNQ
jgi:integrase